MRLWGKLPSERLKTRLVWLLKPKFIVSVWAIIFDEQRRVLLLKHTHDDAHPWGLPSGCVEKGESLNQALRREVLEETGWPIEVRSLLAVEHDNPLPVVRVAYLCRITGGCFHATVEVEDFGFFASDDLPSGLRPLQSKVIEQASEQLRQ
jgi:8-oxo-dGTP pyrophosphatase MutT (NUDIX family)